MIQLRQIDGSAIPVTGDGTFVELVNDVDGTVMLAFLQVGPGKLLQIEPGTKDAQRYEQMFASQGVKFAGSMIIRKSV